jgi:hypothetical protein
MPGPQAEAEVTVSNTVTILSNDISFCQVFATKYLGFMGWESNEQLTLRRPLELRPEDRPKGGLCNGRWPQS